MLAICWGTDGDTFTMGWTEHEVTVVSAARRRGIHGSFPGLPLRYLQARHTYVLSPASTNGRRWLRDQSRSRLNEEWERHMPHFQEDIRVAAEIQRECADAARRTRSEMAEIKAGARKAIAESRELMAKADAVMAKR
jgi:hypothetical protein